MYSISFKDTMNYMVYDHSHVKYKMVIISHRRPNQPQVKLRKKHVKMNCCCNKIGSPAMQVGSNNSIGN